MTDEEEGKVRDKMKSAKMGFPVALVDGAVNSAYKITGVPQTFLIDKKGVIVWRGHPAALEDEQIAELLE